MSARREWRTDDYILPMVSLETNRFRSGYPRRDPHLANIVRLRGGRVTIDEVFERAGEDLAVGVAGDAGWGVGGEDEKDGACEVGGCVGGDPAGVFGGVFGVFGL